MSTIASNPSAMPPKRFGWWNRNRPASCSSCSFSRGSMRASSGGCGGPARAPRGGAGGARGGGGGGGHQLDIAQERLIRQRDLVLDQQPASRAAELAELRQRIDEALRGADDPGRSLARAVVG